MEGAATGPYWPKGARNKKKSSANGGVFMVEAYVGPMLGHKNFQRKNVKSRSALFTVQA